MVLGGKAPKFVLGFRFGAPVNGVLNITTRVITRV